MTLYKVLQDNQSCSNGSFDWTPYLPHDGQPGEWTPTIKPVEMCEHGWHGTNAAHLIYFFHGNQLWEVEAVNPIWDEEADKFVD